jgi:hypothetical protein
MKRIDPLRWCLPCLLFATVAWAESAPPNKQDTAPLFDDATQPAVSAPPNPSPATPSPSEDLFESTDSDTRVPSQPRQQTIPSEAGAASNVPEGAQATKDRSWSDVLSGKVALELRGFPEQGQHRSQDYNHNFSVVFEPQLKTSWGDGQGQFSVVPFLRLDEHDNRRTHFDLREFIASQSVFDFTLRLGIGRVFWGVTESRHTVDIINQTDLVENPDGEDKLGQPMLNVDYASGFGTWHFYFMPFSRLRLYPGVSGRLRPPLPIAQTSPIYNGSAGRSHRDFAGRWSHSLGPLDIGISQFYGTTREPIWRIGRDTLGVPNKLIPVYDVINQTSLDLALAQGNWLWKLEAFTRGGQGSRFEQLTGGFEYTFSGIWNTGADLGLLLEYLYDGRPKVNLSTPFDRDVFVASRIAFNDANSTEILSGVFIDTASTSLGYSVEASRRIGDAWKLNFEARGFANTARDNFTPFFKREHYLMLELERYF